MTSLLLIPGLTIGLTLAYLLIIRPWHLEWGATDKECSLDLPGDNLVPQPDFNATREISINARHQEIWKWIIQIGSSRAGGYIIDWIDNGGKKSAAEILPRYQKIEKGQFIPFTSNQENGIWVAEFKEFKYILWIDEPGKATWLWYIYQYDKAQTRLLTRLRTKYVWKGFWIIYYLLYDFGDIIMMRKYL